MRPGFKINHPADVGAMHPKSSGYTCLCFSRDPGVPDNSDLFVRKFCPTGAFTYRTSPFDYSVCAVISIGAQEEMGWPNARRGIALVANEHSFRDVPKVNNPRCFVGPNGFSFASSAKTSISIGFTTGSPQPTPVCDFNFLPKTPNDGFRKPLSCEEVRPIIRPLNQVHFGCVTLPEVTGLAGATS